MRKNIAIISITLISVLMIFTVVKAGTITPPSGTPSATFYTLSEIYDFITSNTTATEGSPALDFSASLTGTGRTLTEIYTALANRISANKVKIGTTYLGVDGTLYGDTDPTKVLTVSGGTYNASNLTQSNIKLDVAFGVSGELGTLAPDGTAAATDCLDTKTFYSDNSWTQKIGSIATGSNVSGADGSITFSIPNGYYSSKTCAAVDGDLITTNIRSGVNIFGVAGDSNVVNTSSGDAANSDILSGKKAWVDGVEITGNAASYGIPKTGQTTSYVANDDGAYQKGKPASGTHYQDNSDGTITDNATGLMWLKDPSLAGGGTYPNTWASALNTPTIMTWANAIINCEALTYPVGSYSDWRLPNIKELQSIVNYRRHDPAIGESTLESPWINTQSGRWWSSTTFAPYTDYAWDVYFYYGDTGYYDKATSSYVRCVRQ